MFSTQFISVVVAGLIFFLANPVSAFAQSGTNDADRGMLDRVAKTISDITDHGQWDISLSGYAHHDRESYESKRIKRLNEKAWGGGFGKTYRNERGNDESLYTLVIRDSNRNLQYSAGYAYQWIYPVASTGLEVGAGVTGVLISRRDWFDGVPFPAVLPVFSVGSRNIKLMGTYVPHISTKKGKGDVTLLFVKFAI